MSDLKTQVSNVLAKTATAKIKFSLDGISIDANAYKQVKTNIENGKIQVNYSDKIGATAKYRYTHNILFLGFKNIDNSDKEALVIHECTHAACDIAGKAVLVSHSEAAAHVAQCLYYYYINEAALASGNKPTFKSSLLKAAWDVAMTARQNSTLSDEDIKTLMAEIAKHPTYKDGANQNENFDGVA